MACVIHREIRRYNVPCGLMQLVRLTSSSHDYHDDMGGNRGLRASESHLCLRLSLLRLGASRPSNGPSPLLDTESPDTIHCRTGAGSGTRVKRRIHTDSHRDTRKRLEISPGHWQGRLSHWQHELEVLNLPVTSN